MPHLFLEGETARAVFGQVSIRIGHCQSESGEPTLADQLSWFQGYTPHLRHQALLSACVFAAVVIRRASAPLCALGLPGY